MICNSKYFDLKKAFATENTITWPILEGVQKGDIAYFYVTIPCRAILFKCEVLEVGLYRMDDNAKSHVMHALFYDRKQIYMRLKKLTTYPDDLFTDEELKKNGIQNLQTSSRVHNDFNQYIEKKEETLKQPKLDSVKKLGKGLSGTIIRRETASAGKEDSGNIILGSMRKTRIWARVFIAVSVMLGVIMMVSFFNRSDPMTIRAQWEGVYGDLNKYLYESTVNYAEMPVELIVEVLSENGWEFSLDFGQTYSSDIPDEGTYAILYCRYIIAEGRQCKIELRHELGKLTSLAFSVWDEEDYELYQDQILDVWKQIGLEQIGEILGRSSIITDKMQELVQTYGEESVEGYKMTWDDWECTLTENVSFTQYYISSNEKSICIEENRNKIVKSIIFYNMF